MGLSPDSYLGRSSEVSMSRPHRILQQKVLSQFQESVQFHISRPWWTNRTTSHTNMLSAVGRTYIPVGQCPLPIRAAYSAETVVLATRLGRGLVVIVQTVEGVGQEARRWARLRTWSRSKSSPPQPTASTTGTFDGIVARLSLRKP